MNADLSKLERLAFRERVFNAIIGDDGLLSYGDYYKAAEKIVYGLSDVLADAANGELQLSAKKTYNVLLDMLESIYGDGELGKTALRKFAGSIEEALNDQELTQKILDSYEGLLSMGLSNSSIRKIFDSFSFDEIAIYGANGLIDELLGAMLGKHDDYGA